MKKSIYIYISCVIVLLCCKPDSDKKINMETKKEISLDFSKSGQSFLVHLPNGKSVQSSNPIYLGVQSVHPTVTGQQNTFIVDIDSSAIFKLTPH